MTYNVNLLVMTGHPAYIVGSHKRTISIQYFIVMCVFILNKYKQGLYLYSKDHCFLLLANENFLDMIFTNAITDNSQMEGKGLGVN